MRTKAKVNRSCITAGKTRDDGEGLKGLKTRIAGMKSLAPSLGLPFLQLLRIPETIIFGVKRLGPRQDSNFRFHGPEWRSKKMLPKSVYDRTLWSTWKLLKVEAQR